MKRSFAVFSSLVLSAAIVRSQVFESWHEDGPGVMDANGTSYVVKTSEAGVSTLCRLDPLGATVFSVVLTHPLGRVKVSDIVKVDSLARVAVCGQIVVNGDPVLETEDYGVRGYLAAFSAIDGSPVPGWAPDALTMDAGTGKDRSLTTLTMDSGGVIHAAGYSVKANDDQDGWVGKFSPQGALTWGHLQAPGTTADTQDVEFLQVVPSGASAGSVFLAGFSTDDNDNMTAFVRRLGSDGAHAWTKSSANSTLGSSPSAMVLDSSGNPIVLTGSSDDASTVVSKLGLSNGAAVFTHNLTIAGWNSTPVDLVPAPNGDLIVIGQIDTESAEGDSLSACYAARLNAAGTRVWFRTYRTGGELPAASFSGQDLLFAENTLGSGPPFQPAFGALNYDTGAFDNALLVDPDVYNPLDKSMIVGVLRHVGSSYFFGGYSGVGRIDFGLHPKAALQISEETATSATLDLTLRAPRPAVAVLKVYATDPEPDTLLYQYPDIPLAGGTGTVNLQKVIGGLTPNRSFRFDLSLNMPGENQYAGTQSLTTPNFVPGVPALVPAGRNFAAGLGDEINQPLTLDMPANHFTVTFWARPGATSPLLPMIESGGSAIQVSPASPFALFPVIIAPGVASVGVAVGTDGIQVFEHSSDYFPCVLSAPLSIGQKFVHVALVYENRVPRLYVDGLLVSKGVAGALTNALPSVSALGGGPYGQFTGDLSEVRVFSKVLTLGEIAADRTASNPSSASGFVRRELGNNTITSSNANDGTVLKEFYVSGQPAGFPFVLGMTGTNALTVPAGQDKLAVAHRAWLPRTSSLSLTLSATGTDLSFTQAYQFQVDLPSFPPIEIWRVSRFSDSQLLNAAQSGDKADPDMDGVPNLVEYLIGTPPFAATPLPIKLSAGLTTVRIPLKNPAATDFALLLKSSSDLKIWNPETNWTPDNLTNERVYNVPSSARKFFRLEAAPN